MQQQDQFTNRWGIILASLGMAIGAGNLWRFPRLAGQYGGTFILLWILFLLIWSIPLLLSEFAIGKKFKHGVIHSMSRFAGRRFSWMAFFITVCTLGIAFYYSVVTAWSLQYLWLSVKNLFYKFQGISFAETLDQQPSFLQDQWMSISNANWLTIAMFVVVVLAGVFMLAKGIKEGLEKVNKVLIPTLFVLLIVIIFTALSIENGVLGLQYMFTFKVEYFSEPKVWIEALSQSAWSTGAGWGLLMTISSYSRQNEDVTLNTFIGAFGNNTASLIAGMAILPAVFALAPNETEAIHYLQQGNQALTFNVIPNLFARIPGGEFMAVLFFLTLLFAAFSSFLPMIELFVSNLVDFGVARRKTTVFIIITFIAFGFPSAYNLDFFSNQDWVWGLGLILSGFFILFAVAKYNPLKFKEELIDLDSDIQINKWYFSVCIYLNLPIALGLIYWWMSQGYSSDPWFTSTGTWNLFDVYSNATIVTQWGSVLLLGILLNRYLYNRFVIRIL
ncbi:MAG: sodium-dependent transporter [Bacteroidota bacterium]